MNLVMNHSKPSFGIIFISIQAHDQKASFYPVVGFYLVVGLCPVAPPCPEVEKLEFNFLRSGSL